MLACWRPRASASSCWRRAVGVAQAGGSRRAALLALLGSVAGGVVGMIVGVGMPIPLVGSIVAAVLFAALAAMGGRSSARPGPGKNPRRGWRVAKRAFWGRLAGTLAKVLFGAVMLATVVVALVL